MYSEIEKKLDSSLENLIDDRRAPRTEACRDFQRGECLRGATCPYLHTNDPSVVTKKREDCRDLTLRGHCTRGEACPYRHPSYLRVNETNVEICRDYLRGECARAPCPYAHSDDVVPVCREYIRGACSRDPNCPYHHLSNFVSNGAENCRDFQRGHCSRGADCPFAHVPEYVEVCRNFQKGLCRRGNTCTFHHGRGGPIRVPEEPQAAASVFGRKRRLENTVDEDLIDFLKREIKLLKDENLFLRKENAALKKQQGFR